MRFPRKRGSTSVMCRIFIPDNSVTTGAGLTGLTSASTNLTITYIRELDASGTAYTGANIEAQTTIGTFQAPSSSAKIRFKAVDATNLPGVYELQFSDSATAFGTGDTSQNVTINIFEATTSALHIGPNMVLIPLVPWDYQDGVRMGLTALPNAAAGASGGVPLSADASGRVDVLKINGTSQTARDIGASVLLSSGSGTGQITLTSGAVTTGTNNDKTGYALTSGYDPAKTAAQAGDAMALTSGERVSVGTAVWATTARSLTTFGTLVADVTTAVWAAGTRSLTTFGTLVADTATAVWASVTRTLTAASDSSGVTTLLSRIASALTITTGKVDVNTLPNPAPSGYGGGTAPTVQEITDGVWDEPIADHLDAGSTGNKLNSAAAAGDPWSTALPGSYADHEAGKILAKLDVPPPDEFVVVIPAPGVAEQCACYVVTRDGHGDIEADVTITFNLFSAPIKDSYYTGSMTAISDDNGVASINLRRLARYEGRRSNGTIIRFTVPDSDTFQLPQVLGNP